MMITQHSNPKSSNAHKVPHYFLTDVWTNTSK